MSQWSSLAGPERRAFSRWNSLDIIREVQNLSRYCFQIIRYFICHYQSTECRKSPPLMSARYGHNRESKTKIVSQFNNLRRLPWISEKAHLYRWCKEIDPTADCQFWFQFESFAISGPEELVNEHYTGYRKYGLNFWQKKSESPMKMEFYVIKVQGE